MNSDILALLLAPLSIALLVLYLQQMAKVNELRADAEAKKNKVEELSLALKRSAEQYEEALRAAKVWYETRTDGTEAQRDDLRKLFLSSREVIQAMSKAYSELHDFKFKK